MHSLIEGALPDQCPTYVMVPRYEQFLSGEWFCAVVLRKVRELAVWCVPFTTCRAHAGNSMSGMDTFKTMVTNIFKVIL